MAVPRVVETWQAELNKQQNSSDDPNYFVSKTDTLITTSDPVSFITGTGSEILSSVLHSCESTVDELIIVTCFWASSPSQRAINQLLLNLSIKGKSRKIRVRLCISSLSLIQKLNHTSSTNGHVYHSNSWQKLGLPPASQLSGLDLIVKTIFVRPFSVMHPKFIIMDRERAWFPSCNVSWEEWFEGCIELRGEITSKLFDFWAAFWGREGGGMELPPSLSSNSGRGKLGNLSLGGPAVPTRTKSGLLGCKDLAPSTTNTILLPSPHHRLPNFRYFSRAEPPATPLNLLMLTLFSTAVNSIWILTPNLTCGPVVEYLFSALRRGINVTIVTSRRLMVLEQLVTAGTITELELWKLRRRYRRIAGPSASDLEPGLKKPGSLRIGYFQPLKGEGEPVKSHLKMTVVDDEIVVLGSGNMDRASWYTSQELGIALLSSDETKSIKDCVMSGLKNRVEWICR